MSKDSNTFGGFDILGDILTSGPDGINSVPNDPFDVSVDDPIVDPSQAQDMNDDTTNDPSNANTVVDTTNSPESVVELPDLQNSPSDTSSVQPPSSNPVNTDQSLDLTEEEPLMVQYLQENLYERYGWELKDDEKLNSIEELTGFIEDVIERSSKPKYNSPEIEQLDQYVANGGNLEKYLEQRYSGNIDVEKLDMTNTTNQSLVLREYFKRQGMSIDKIEQRLQTYDDTGILSEEATYAYDLLKKQIKKESDTLLQTQQKMRDEAESRQQKYIDSVLSNIDNRTDVRGLKINEAQKKKLKDYILKPDQSGYTGFQKTLNESVDAFIEAAYFMMDGKGLVGQLNQQATSEAAKQLKERLAAKTKRNKNISQNGDINKGDTNALALLGSSL